LSNSVIGDYQQAIAGGSSALIIVLPANIDPTLLPQWRQAEHLLLTNELIIPVYFTFESDDLQEIMNRIEVLSGEEQVTLQEKLFNTILGNNFQITVTTAEPSALKKFSTTNLQGWLSGSGDANSPTIALVANYDSLSASPLLAQSARSSSSGAAVLLEMSRLFHQLYSHPRTQGRYNLLFVLATGGHFNFMGSKQWLNQADERITRNLEAVICLDQLGEDSNDLYLHASRPEKDPVAKRLYDSFRSAAGALDRNLQVMHHKVNVSNSEEPWEHEHFSKQRLLACTLSTNAEPLPNLGRSHIFDNVDTTKSEVLSANTRLFAEALGRFMFSSLEQDNTLVFENTLGVDEKMQFSWLSTLTGSPRMLPYISDNLVDGLERTLNSYCSDVSRQSFELSSKSEYRFFSAHQPTEVVVSISKPFVFDVILALLITGYLSGLYFVVQVCSSLLALSACNSFSYTYLCRRTSFLNKWVFLMFQVTHPANLTCDHAAGISRSPAKYNLF